MSILDNALGKFGLLRQSKVSDPVTTDEEDLQRDRTPYITMDWFFTPYFGQPRKINVLQLRNMGKSIWVKTLKNNIKNEVTRLDWDIVEKDNDGPMDPEAKRQKQEALEFFDNGVNSNNENIETLNKMILDDLMDLDAGVMIKVFTRDSYERDKNGKEITRTVEAKSYDGDLVKKRKDKDLREGQFEFLAAQIPQLKPFGQRELKELWVRDGGSFLKNVDRRGKVHGYFQYSYHKPMYAPVPYANEEISYNMMNPRSDSVYGYSPLESSKEIVEALNWTIIHNRELLKSGAIPDFIGNLIGADKKQLKKWKMIWKKNFEGKRHKIAWNNVEDIQMERLNLTSEEMEWLDSQKWYFKLLAAQFQVPPEQVGLKETSKADSDSKENKEKQTAIKPYIKILERMYNNDIIPEILQEQPLIELKFDFIDLNEEARSRANDNMDLDRGVVTINEVRSQRGWDPVPWGNVPMRISQTPGGFEGGTSEDATSQFKKKGLETKARETRVTEKAEYIKLYERQLKDMEKEVLKAVEEEFPKKQKSFGNFLRKLFGAVFTARFFDEMEDMIKGSFIKAMMKASKETGVELEVTDSMREQARTMAQQQIEGYTLPSGDRWPGIKGATDELRKEIQENVLEGVNAGEGAEQIAKRVKKTFDVSENRALTIARTESMRIQNAALEEGFRKAGVPGKKIWIAKLDHRTSEICERLNGQEVPINQNFQDESGSYKHPPAHPNCRSTIAFRPEF